jgi:hypothetical protein
MRNLLSLVFGIATIALTTPGFGQVNDSTKDYFIGINRHLMNRGFEGGGGLNIGFVQGQPGERTLRYVEAGVIEDYAFYGPFVGIGYDFEIYDKLFLGGVMSIGSDLLKSNHAGEHFRFAIGAEARYILWETLQLRGGYTYGHGITIGYALQW